MLCGILNLNFITIFKLNIVFITELEYFEMLPSGQMRPIKPKTELSPRATFQLKHTLKTIKRKNVVIKLTFRFLISVTTIALSLVYLSHFYFEIVFLN